MSRTAIYRQQHRDILSVAAELKQAMVPARLASDARQAHGVLAKLAGCVGVHLTMEDDVLYPALVSDANEAVRATARRFVDEMGNIRTAFQAYLARWPTSHSIEMAPHRFVEETSGLLEVLAGRIRAEDDHLYAMVDRLN